MKNNKKHRKELGFEINFIAYLFINITEFK